MLLADSCCAVAPVSPRETYLRLAIAAHLTQAIPCGAKADKALQSGSIGKNNDNKNWDYGDWSFEQKCRDGEKKEFFVVEVTTASGKLLEFRREVKQNIKWKVGWPHTAEGCDWGREGKPLLPPEERESKYLGVSGGGKTTWKASFRRYFSNHPTEEKAARAYTGARDAFVKGGGFFTINSSYPISYANKEEETGFYLS